MTATDHRTPERRRHRRLALRWPIECKANLDPHRLLIRGLTDNISSGGLYLLAPNEKGNSALAEGTRLDVEFTVPPGEGHFPTEGRVRGTARVVRCEPIHASSDETQPPAADRNAPTRLGIAAVFERPIQLVF